MAVDDYWQRRYEMRYGQVLAACSVAGAMTFLVSERNTMSVMERLVALAAQVQQLREALDLASEDDLPVAEFLVAELARAGGDHQ